MDVVFVKIAAIKIILIKNARTSLSILYFSTEIKNFLFKIIKDIVVIKKILIKNEPTWKKAGDVSEIITRRLGKKYIAQKVNNMDVYL